MRKIAVMNYNTGAIEIITTENEIQYNDVETYLDDVCNYNMDEIYWMGFDKGKISFLTEDDFSE